MINTKKAINFLKDQGVFENGYPSLDLKEQIAIQMQKYADQQLILSGVSHQREQLIAYELHMLRSTEEKDRLYWAKKSVDKYLSN